MAAVVGDVQNLLNTFKDTQTQGVEGIIQHIKTVWTKATRALEFVPNEDRIKELIQSAKHIETSQYMALSTVLLVQTNCE